MQSLPAGSTPPADIAADDDGTTKGVVGDAEVSRQDDAELQDHEATIVMCSKLIAGGQGPGAIGRLARRRSLPLNLLRDHLFDQFVGEARGALLRAFAGSQPLDNTTQEDAVDAAQSGARRRVDELVQSVRSTGTLMVDNRFDRRTVAAAALLAKSSERYLDFLAAKLRKVGGDPSEVEGWVEAVERVLHGRSIRLISSAEMMNRPDPKFTVDGLIEEGSFAVLFSHPGTGKTFIALDWCFSVAMGLPWLGRDVMTGPTVYVAAEGTGGLPKRIRALDKHHHTNGTPPPDFYFIDQAVNLLEPGIVAEAVAAVEDLGIRPKLIVFDTYARSMVGGDENSAQDAGQAIASIDRLRFSLGAAVLVVHHIGKKGTEERGSGALRGAADTMIVISGTPSSLELRVDKQKNFEIGLPISLRLDSVAESLVPVEGPTGNSAAWGAAASEPDHPEGDTTESKMATELIDALKRLEAEGKLPVTQTNLKKLVKGNGALKSAVLDDLVGDDSSEVMMTKDGKTYLYSLSH